ncbi:hypothetical protein F0L68_00355 [Solihabitans fulvus]|uniref:Uncharacterized protein n=1 Tax=Solihabitans fulvus TaxID=1892852 RepID=A0A5B2XWF6_9PSEU|nr:hypothetical protein [Solihabitans fulvus]KAA2267024.1 hypothetical protein F0L68_00355 [Solihabitans fulvus]
MQLSALWTTVAVSVTVLIVILASDLGSRRVTRMRLIRPLVAVAVVIAVFFRLPSLAGNDLALQVTGAGVGIILGLVAGVLLPARLDQDGVVRTSGGALYAAFWVLVSAARVLFVYGAEHWFTEGLIRFCVTNRISGPDVFANAFVLLALAMVLARTAVVLVRSRRLRAGERHAHAER